MALTATLFCTAKVYIYKSYLSWSFKIEEKKINANLSSILNEVLTR